MRTMIEAPRPLAPTNAGSNWGALAAASDGPSETNDRRE